MSEGNSPSKTFLGVRFILLGFDPLHEQKVRSKLVGCGAVDVGHYSLNCSHVVVDKTVFDDPVCVAARNDGKTLVTALWVHHSFDVGVPVESTSIIYRPLKDLNGIPDAKSLIVCLTGYQRQDRDDIMTMVGLMGAQFSKPLVANKVTHLICYKFEGEKYELAKKIPKIKLVNHRWLEDCLRDWALLPEDDYNKSGYEMEMMEAEARDSEDEAENTIMKQSGGTNMYKSPLNIKSPPATSGMPKSEGDVPKVPMNFYNAMDHVLIPQNENKLGQASSFSSAYVSNGVSCQNACKFRDGTDGELNDQHHRTPDPEVRDDLTSNFGTAERPAHSARTLSYSRQTPLKSTLPLHVGDKSSNGSVSSKVPICKSNANFGLASYTFKADQENNKIDSSCVEVPLKGIHSQNGEESRDIFPRKRTMDLSYGSSKSQKMNHDAEAGIICSPSSSDKSPKVKPTSMVDGSYETTSHYVIRNYGRSLDKTGNLSAVESSYAGTSPTKSSTVIRKPLACDLSFSATVTSETVEDGNGNKKTPLTTFQRLRKSSLSSKPGIVDCVVEKPTFAVSKTVELQNQHQDVEGLSSNNKKSVTNNSNDPASLNLLKDGNNHLDTKSVSKGMISKKILVSGPKLTSANQKGSVCLGEAASLNDTTFHLNSGDHEKSPGAIKLDMLYPGATAEPPKEVEGKDVTMTADVAENNIQSMDEETEAPEEESEHKLENVLHEAKAIGVQSTSKCVTTEEKSEGMQQMSDHSDACVHGDAMASAENTDGNEREMTVSDRISLLVESSSEGDGVKGKKNKGKKRALGKTKFKAVPAVADVMKPKKFVCEEDTQNENIGETQKELEKIVGKSKRSVPKNKLENSSKMKENRPIVCGDQSVSAAKQQAGKSTEDTQNENIGETEKELEKIVGKSKGSSVPKNKLENSSKMKENRLIVCGDQSVSMAEQQAGKSTVKSNITPLKINQTSVEISPNSTIPEGKAPSNVKTEPVWFILSGDKFQRKDFRQVIRCLKGRCCRDSHHWSYQATHLIAPGPIKRTEKFFAATASGRWILKSDYLAASNQAGRFLAEEPYEWHQNGLSEDGAINLEAPRKWRLLRERTGHGAFHGMRIIIYGECIAPPLDTLKRVVKAGDGTILATCPPYTRFLDTGVDFAIVSPGMPRVDMWVQEFLKHKIPCVATDYLVEYVCKPGYPLERHVLHNTHAWAENSFGRLQRRAEEIVEDVFAPQDSSGGSDIPCVVCGSVERGEVMLICGNESGSVGCGVGTHIDCCNPPLEDVPEGDWFCPKCSRSKNSTSSSKKRKKGKSK
ncbi:hypothetical protein CerSpe_297590 [Prunus speciosa]